VSNEHWTERRNPGGYHRRPVWPSKGDRLRGYPGCAISVGPIVSQGQQCFVADDALRQGAHRLGGTHDRPGLELNWMAFAVAIVYGEDSAALREIGLELGASESDRGAYVPPGRSVARPKLRDRR
jgi:hypothetical protein